MEDLAQSIINLVGGISNIQAASHCATRIRLTLKDQSKVQTEALNAIPDVMKVMSVGTQTQIVVGADAPTVYQKIAKQLETSGVPVSEEKEENKEGKKSFWGR